MKKIYMLLVLCLSLVCIASQAQNTNCSAEFSFTIQNGNSVHFSPAVIGDSANTRHHWNFGNGNTSTMPSPTNVYNAPGTYTIVHVIERFGNGAVVCTATFSKTVQVQDYCNISASFSKTALSPNSYKFQPLATNLATTDSIRWSFGDGTFSNDFAPQHSYNQAGNYKVCLRIQRRTTAGTSVTCVKEHCDSVTIASPDPCNLNAQFNHNQIGTTAGSLSYHFQNTSIGLAAGDSIKWSFGDGHYSNTISPNHTYTNAGTYTVCLKIIKRTLNGVLTNCSSYTCYTITVNHPDVCNLVASFQTAKTSVNSFHFQNTSTGLAATDSIRWTFGDGTTSNALNPDHTYAQSGVYQVCLRIQKRNSVTPANSCVKEYCETITVQIPATCTLVAGFQAYRDSSVANNYRYKFQNTTAGVSNTDSIKWTFGDGSSSNDLHASHTYANAGTYKVCLRIIKRNPNGVLTNCVAEICHTVVVPYSCNLVAGFTYTANTLFNYQFKNTSAPVSNSDSIRWTFGDGNSSNQVNPGHIYSQAGTYKVCLRVQKRTASGALESCAREVCHTIIISAPCNADAKFTWKADDSNGRKIYFANGSPATSAAATATWSYGDGTTGTGWNSVHEYAKAGRYLVCLRVQWAPNCVSEFCDSVIVHEPQTNCQQMSQFSFSSTTNRGKTIQFTPAKLNTTLQYTWTFGDGTGSHSPITSHEYQKAGTYTACLTVFKNANCASTTCKTVTVTDKISCDDVNVSFEYKRDPAAPNKLHFQAASNRNIISQTWQISKKNSTGTPVILSQNNPVFVFADTGWYKVCLRAVTTNGSMFCTKEYCREIYISHHSNPTNCILQLYPNPASTVVNLNVTLGQPRMIDLYIYNSVNVLVKEFHQQGASGNNFITVNVADLIAGNYSIKLIHGNDICQAKFVKL